MICIDTEELKSMFETKKKEELSEEILRRGLTSDQLKADRALMEEVAETVQVKMNNNKEDIELFVVSYCLSNMYSESGQICFPLKDSVNPKDMTTATLDELKESIKEGHSTDFGIMLSDGFRQFQLKQYKEKLDTDTLFSFIEKKVKHYGGDLGDTNLLVLLQSEDGLIDNVDFKDLVKRITDIDIKSDSEILIYYNEANKVDVINRVYPKLSTCRKESDRLSV